MSNNKEKYFTNYANVILGGTPKTDNPNYWGGTIPWASIEDFNDSRYIENTAKSITEMGLNNSSTKLLEIGDIIISARGTVGKIVQCKQRMAFNQSCYALKTKDSETLNQDFLYYFLIYKVLEFKQIAIGGVFDTITMKTFEKMPVHFPDVKVQKKIAAILTAYDDLIETNNKRIQILEKMAEEIYREWFVRMRFPGYENVKFIKGMPSSWEIKKLKQVIVDIIDYRGKTPGKLKSNWSEEGIIALSALNIKNGKLVKLDKAKRVTEELYEKWMQKKLMAGDILLTSEAPLGELHYFIQEERFVLSQRLFGIRANKKIIKSVYLYSYLASLIGQYELRSKATGSTVDGIRQELLRKIDVVVPDDDLQLLFESKVLPILTLNHNLIKQNEYLFSSREMLLTRLVSGKIKVENLEIKLPPSMEEVNA